MEKENSISNEEDRISELPDAILQKILSEVDMKEVVQSSILSKRWKDLWVSIPILNFDHYRWMVESTLEFQPQKFTNFINQVFLFHCENPNEIQKITFSCEGYERETDQIEKWVACAILLNVKELHLERVDLVYTTLLGHVKTLKLISVYIGSDFMQRERLLRLEKVENLVIEDCEFWHVGKFTVLAPLLNKLKIVNWNLPHCAFVLRSPKLTSLEFEGCFFDDYNMGKLASLVDAYVCIELNEIKSGVLDTCLNKILGTIVNVKSLRLSANAFQNSAELPSELKGGGIVFNNLRFLKLSEWHTDGHIGAVGKLLELFPCVETLILERTKEQLIKPEEHDPFHKEFLNYLKSRGQTDSGLDETTSDEEEKCGDWGAQLSFQCMLNELKIIEVRDLEGHENEYKFLVFLLNNARNLEKITFKVRKVLSADEEKELVEFCKKLLCVASAGVKIVLVLKTVTGFAIVFEETSSSTLKTPQARKVHVSSLNL